MKAKRPALPCLLCLALLQACGGGGGSSRSPAPATPDDSPQALSFAVDQSISLTAADTGASGTSFQNCKWSYRKIKAANPDLDLGNTEQCTLSFTAPSDSGKYVLALSATNEASAAVTDEVNLNIYEQLMPNYRQTYVFRPLDAATIYEVTMEQEPCPRGLCCSLSYGDPSKDRLLSREATPDPATNLARLLVQDRGGVEVHVDGLNVCRYYTPEFAEAENLVSSRSKVSVSGQRPVSASGRQARRFQLDVTRIGERLYLHDTSRQGKGLAEGASITAMRFMRNSENPEAYGVITHQGTNAESLDKAAVDAHGYTLAMHDYLKKVLERDSYDHAGAPMVTVTGFDIPLATGLLCGTVFQAGTLWNAFWSNNGKFIGFTHGFPADARQPDMPGSVALDIVAHEWGHALTDSLADLTYARESGALNEAFSDWVAAAVEHHLHAGNANWLLGEDVEAIRSLEDPTRYGSSILGGYKGHPDIYQRAEHWRPTDTAKCPTADICSDWCGVHSNSGVGNKMFYLLSMGGTFNKVTVTGIGVQVAMKIAIDAHEHHWSMSSDYAAARAGMVTAAMAYDAANTTSTKAQVENAWKAVGVEPPSP